MKRLCVIPARGNSVRLKRKNLRPLHGKPLLLWTLDTVRESALFDRIVVSTEDDEVANMAREAGADVPFLRPAHLSESQVRADAVALHVLEALGEAGEQFNILGFMLPTCPFRSVADIRDAFELFCKSGKPNLMSVNLFDHTPFAALALGNDGLLTPHFPEYYGRQSQDMPAAYRPNGAIHFLDVPWFLKSRSYLEPPVLAYVMPRERSFDIDTAEDLAAAEAMIAHAAASAESRA